MRPVTTYAAVVGAVLSVLRERRRFSQKNLTEIVGLSESGWSRIESGMTPITLDRLRVVANVFDVSPAQIVLWADSGRELLVQQGAFVFDVGVPVGDVATGNVAVLSRRDLVARLRPVVVFG